MTNDRPEFVWTELKKENRRRESCGTISASHFLRVYRDISGRYAGRVLFHIIDMRDSWVVVAGSVSTIEIAKACAESVVVLMESEPLVPTQGDDTDYDWRLRP